MKKEVLKSIDSVEEYRYDKKNLPMTQMTLAVPGKPFVLPYANDAS